MSNTSKNFLKSKLMKNTVPKIIVSPSEVSSTLYSGVASTQRYLRPGGYLFFLLYLKIDLIILRSSHSVRSNQSKRISERSITLAPKDPDPPIRYHPWEPTYNQVYNREKIKKSMTKDPYRKMKRSFAQATESIATEEECCPIIIPFKVVHIEQPIIHQKKVICKFIFLSTFKILNISVPNVVRYLRGNELLPSQRFAQQTAIKNPPVSQLQVETNEPIPVIGSNKTRGTAPILTTMDRLLKRDKIRNDASVIRRPPRRLLINTMRETIVPITVYG